MNSYEKVNYLLRPKKQIERKLIIETLQCLDPLINVRQYFYLGLGSIYFSDFILFHKYLNINNLYSIDNKKSDEARFNFNIPFGFINFKLCDSTYYLQNILDWKNKALIWLDYDGVIDKVVYEDVNFISAKAKPLDIFLVTLNSECKNAKTFRDTFADFVPKEFSLGQIKENYPLILNSIINEWITIGLNTKTEKLRFLPLFSFSYNDNVRMYTYGGIFYKEDQVDEIRTRLNGLDYISFDNNIHFIDCPIITQREKMHLDSIKKSEIIDTEEALKTGLSEEAIKDYYKYYKYYPQYFESIY